MPELLAPAGSIESFHAAVDAGADAVYLGLTDFNARIRAKNFTVKTLSYLVPWAHKHSVNVYVTLNTLIKQSELEQVFHVLYQLEQIGIDAVISADLGITEIVKKNFPGLKLHASTQMAIHNSAGVQIASRLGFTRTVLARELTLEEIRFIKNSTKLELELFIHGALCYSLSGLCLASSFLGGSSGNRGRCTQVCRRKFNASGKKGYFFSPDDFCAADHIPEFIKAGVSSFKIEGRMKGPEYVHTVVGAYRKLIDNTGKVAEIKTQLLNDLGRPKTSFFLDGPREDLINPESPSGTGLKLGEVLECSGDHLRVSGDLSVNSGDRIRIHSQDGFEGTSANVHHVESENGIIDIKLKAPIEYSRGDSVYIVSRRSAQLSINSSGRFDTAPVPFKPFYGPAKSIIREFETGQKQKTRPELWVKVDNTGWLEHLSASPCSQLIFAGDYDSQMALLNSSDLMRIWRSRLHPAFPPFIPEAETRRWRELINAFSGHGVKKWVCTNIGQVSFFPPKSELIADNPVWALNHAAHTVLKKLGFSLFTYSTEDEYLNIRDSASVDGIAYLFSHVPMFISKIKPQVKTDKDISDPHKNLFFISQRDGLYYTLTKKPLCLLQRKVKLQEAGINRFLIDLSFTAPEKGLFEMIFAAYKSGEKIEGSSLFNFKAGLK